MWLSHWVFLFVICISAKYIYSFLGWPFKSWSFSFINIYCMLFFLFSMLTLSVPIGSFGLNYYLTEQERIKSRTEIVIFDAKTLTCTLSTIQMVQVFPLSQDNCIVLLCMLSVCPHHTEPNQESFALGTSHTCSYENISASLIGKRAKIHLALQNHIANLHQQPNFPGQRKSRTFNSKPNCNSALRMPSQTAAGSRAGKKAARKTQVIKWPLWVLRKSL